MPNYVHIELEMLERVADPYEWLDVVSLKAYAAIARSHVMRGRSNEKPINAAEISGLNEYQYEKAVEHLTKAAHVREEHGVLAPRTSDDGEYLRKSNAGGSSPATSAPYIQIADNLFRRRKQPVGKTLPPVFPLLSPEQFFLFCLLIQGVRLPAFLGVTPDYVTWKDDKPTLSKHLKRTLEYAQVKTAPEELLLSLLEGDTKVFELIDVPMQPVDDYTETLTFVPPWDRRNSDNQPEGGWGVGESRHRTPKQNDWVKVLLPIIGYEVSYKRDAAFFCSMTVLPDVHSALKGTLNKHYGNRNREYWQRYGTTMFPEMTVDDLMRAIQPYA